MSVRILHGALEDRIPELIAEGVLVDAIVCDPPYHLKNNGGGPHGKGLTSPYAAARAGATSGGFMGMTWDGGDVARRPETWAMARDVLKPGGHLLAFGGTRTHHRVMCAIEDAGFELRDVLMWVYGSGFPKSKNYPDEFPGMGTALKPAWEPIILARKPLVGNVAENMRAHGVGMLDIDGCRIGHASEDDRLSAFPGGKTTSRGSGTLAGGGQRKGERTEFKSYADRSATNFAATPGPRGGDLKGRWPANVAHDGSPEVLAAFPNVESGQPAGVKAGGKLNVYGTFAGGIPVTGYGDAGSAARFFKTCELDDTEWLLENLPISPALIAAGSFSLSRLLDAIAQSDAATLALPGGTQLSACPAPSMSVTPKESRSLAKAVITAILTIGPRCLREWRHERLSPSGSVVEVVATREPTGTMTITASRWKSDGYAVPVTFSITPLNSEPGAKDSSARFRYCAKADRTDRNEGCEHLQAKPLNWSSGTESPGTFQAEGTDRTSPNHHPTVKPTDLMRWLVRMVTPPGGLVLDPFAGSGSTGKAATLEGRDCILIEREAEYVEIARARVAHASGPLFAEVTA